MIVNKFRVLSMGVKNVKLGIRLEKIYVRSEESRQNSAETDRVSYYNQEEWLEESLVNKGGFYNGSESDGSDNDDEIYNENNEQL